MVNPVVLGLIHSALKLCHPRVTHSVNASSMCIAAFSASLAMTESAVADSGARLALRRAMKSFQTCSLTPLGFSIWVARLVRGGASGIGGVVSLPTAEFSLAVSEPEAVA